jgi:hypothetical protein
MRDTTWRFQNSDGTVSAKKLMDYINNKTKREVNN